MLRLKDVAEIQFGHELGGFTRVDGKPAALIAVTAWPGTVTADQFIKRAESIRELPPGISFDVVADRSADHFLAVEVQVPPGSMVERTKEVVAKATELIRGLPGKPSTFAFADAREPNAAKIFVKVCAKIGPNVTEIDKALAGVPGTMIRIGDVPAGEEAFPARIALLDPGEFRDPGERAENRFLEVTERVLANLVKDKDVVQPAAFPVSPAPKRIVDIDRDKCAQSRVELNDLLTTLQASLGRVHATDIHMFGRAFKVNVQMAPQFTRHIEDMKMLSVRSVRGETVFLASLIKFRKSSGPTTVVRVNGYRAIIITAARTSGKTPAEVAAKCVKLAQEVLPRGYHATNLTGP